MAVCVPLFMLAIYVLNEHSQYREEQHDDQILHELLRCFKALSTSEIGCVALRSAAPAPYQALVRLLYSDKKPGEVPTRQLIVDLLLGLFDMYPAGSSLPMAAPSRSSPPIIPSSYSYSSSDDLFGPERSMTASASLPSPYRNLYSFMRGLLLTPAPPPSEGRVSDIDHHEVRSDFVHEKPMI